MEERSNEIIILMKKKRNKIDERTKNAKLKERKKKERKFWKEKKILTQIQRGKLERKLK